MWMAVAADLLAEVGVLQRLLDRPLPGAVRREVALVAAHADDHEGAVLHLRLRDTPPIHITNITTRDETLPGSPQGPSQSTLYIDSSVSSD